MERKAGSIYIKVPCVDNVGSCNYGNICEVWAGICPTYFERYAPCNCPVPARNYSVPTTAVDITASLPSIVSGAFRITSNFVSSAGRLGCLEFEVNLQT